MKSISRSICNPINEVTRGSSGGRGSNAFTFRAGTVGDPTAGTGIAGASTMWFAAESLPVESELTKIQYYMTGAGNAILLLAVPRALGGFTVSIIATKASAAGLNTFTVAAGELPATTIPANSLIGIKCATGQEVRYSVDLTAHSRVRTGGLVFASGWTGAGGTYAINFTDQDELSFAWEATTRRGSKSSAIYETFGTSCPAWAFHSGTAWTYATGIATPGATGIANRLSWAFSSGLHLQTLAIDLKFTTSDSKLVIGKGAVTNLVQDGTLISVDISTNAIQLYNVYASAGTLPSVFDTQTITEFTLQQNHLYTLELIKINQQIQAKITDTVTSASQTFTWPGSASYGLALGRPTLFSLAGVPTVHGVRWTFGKPNPKFTIYGDSITQGTGADSNLSVWSGQLCESGRGMFCGDGGVRANISLRNIIFDVRNVMPRYVVLNCGVNNSDSDTERDYGIADFRTACQRIRQYGAIPVLATPTTYNNAARQARIDAIRDAMVADSVNNDIRIIRLDRAVGGPTGSVFDAAKMYDSAHPNQIGYDDMTDQAISDQPNVF